VVPILFEIITVKNKKTDSSAVGIPTLYMCPEKSMTTVMNNGFVKFQFNNIKSFFTYEKRVNAKTVCQQSAYNIPKYVI